MQQMSWAVPGNRLILDLELQGRGETSKLGPRQARLSVATFSQHCPAGPRNACRGLHHRFSRMRLSEMQRRAVKGPKQTSTASGKTVMRCAAEDRGGHRLAVVSSSADTSA
ncbi:unnamed protein product [Cercospora beticola]|nr:unnamed protein product [Cercospora beticola]